MSSRKCSMQHSLYSMNVGKTETVVSHCTLPHGQVSGCGQQACPRCQVKTQDFKCLYSLSSKQTRQFFKVRERLGSGELAFLCQQIDRRQTDDRQNDRQMTDRRCQTDRRRQTDDRQNDQSLHPRSVKYY